MTLKNDLARLLVLQAAIVCELLKKFVSRIKLTLFHQRCKVIEAIAERDLKTKPKDKVLVVLTHVVSREEAVHPDKTPIKLERIIKTLDGIIISFSQYDYKIILNTVPKQHLVAFLPEYQRRVIEVHEQKVDDPMFVEFKTQDEFINRKNDFDWFVFIEDDIIIHDSWLIEKIAMFNKYSDDIRALLIPHRYEMCNGEKTYVDLIGYHWNALSIKKIGNIEFAECSNPHGAFHCLSKSQLEVWIKSGRYWNNRVSMVGPLESAATGCLFEAFTLYKAHPRNLSFLEVQHFDTKYTIKFAPNKKNPECP